MTSFELLAVVVLFLIGYWLVSAIWPKLWRKDDAPAPRGSPDADSWHEILGVSPTASADEIEQAYRAQLDKYHPDEVAQLAPELQALARQMTERINAAYGQARGTKR